MSELALFFIALAVAGGVILYRMPDHLSVDRDMGKGCLALAMIAVGVVGVIVIGAIALLGGLK